MNRSGLPIEEVLCELRTSLRLKNRLILQAPPGAGKTTRVPLAVLNEDWLVGKTILMVEPRRLAASNAASYMAAQLGEQIGNRIGYTIRYQRKTSSQTRIEVVTEGVLTRRLQQDPELTGVGLVIFDEFHERHLQSDLALALCCDVQQELRSDLRLLVMSATLDADPLARLLDAPILTSKGRSYPVEIHYLPKTSHQNLVENTVAGIRRALDETSGDLLAFLPGEGEIRRCQERLLEFCDRLDIRPLFGNLPFADQERAILPGERRRLVLATNIAETSLTIEGISVVIDSGFCRRARFDQGSGLSRLELGRISRASAEQRAGRAGRLGPGTCYRLWSEATQGALLPFTPPEIRAADLAPLALELLNWGVGQPDQLTWLDPPPATAWQAALDLLAFLGCATPQGQLTDIGRELCSLPAHPRLGCLLLKAQQLNLLPLGCELVALLSEPDPWFKTPPPRLRSRSDLLDRLEAYRKLRHNRNLSEFQGVDRAVRYWRDLFRLAEPSQTKEDASVDQLAELLLCAFPDRIGRRRADCLDRYQLSSGQGVRLGGNSALGQEEYLIAVELRKGSKSEAEITRASAVDKELLAKLYPELPWQPELYWDNDLERIISISRRRLGALILAEKPIPADLELQQQAVLDAVRASGLRLLNLDLAAEDFIARINFLRRIFPEEDWPDFTRESLIMTLEDWLLPFLGSAGNRADLEKIDILQALRSRFDWRHLQRLESLAPERYQVPSGSRIRLRYPSEGSPILAVKLQEMFGQTETPEIAEGRCPLLVQLLSPAGRPLQTTQDLTHFWQQGYPEIRKEMKGRYPKHPWPDDPLTAVPTAKTKRKLAQQGGLNR